MKRGHALGGAAALLAGLTLFASRPASEAPATPSGAAATQAPAPTAAGARFFRELGNADPGPPIEIALTDQQELIADSALRAVFDSYLFERSGDGGLQALRDNLRRKLPPAAAQDAVSLAERYADYIKAHDALLAAQNFHGAADPVRLANWQQQRRQLRVRLLGARVADEWFGADEAYLEEALAESRQSPASPPANEDELRHRQYMQQVLRDAISRAGPARRLDAPPTS